MSTSFMQIKPIRTQQHLQERVSHIVQEGNRFKGVINNIIFLNQNFSSQTEVQQISVEKKISRSDFTRKRGSYKSQLKKQQAKLKKAQFEGDSKAMKRAEAAIKRNQVKLDELLALREALNDGREQNGGANKISYREIVFSITGVRHLLEDEQYANRLYSLSKEFLIESISAKIVKAVIHRDQPGEVPHIHYLVEYDSENSFSNDMKKKYKDDEKHIEDLNMEWEKKVKESGVIEQFNIEYEDIVKGGKREYTTLKKYKRQQKETLEEVTNEAIQETKQLKAKIIRKSKDKKGDIDKTKVLNSLLNSVKSMKIELKLLISSLSTNKLLKKNNQLNFMLEKLKKELERKERVSSEFYQESVEIFKKRVRAKNTALIRAEHKLSKLTTIHNNLQGVHKEKIEEVESLIATNKALEKKILALEKQYEIMKRAKAKIGATLKRLRLRDNEHRRSLIDIIDK